MRQLLQELVRESPGYVELRYHDRRTNSVRVEKARVESARVNRRRGVGVRVLEEGTFGFASTGSANVGQWRAMTGPRRFPPRAVALAHRRSAPPGPPETVPGDAAWPAAGRALMRLTA